MKILVIGSGGREHALAWRLSKSSKLSELFVTPGNTGTALCAKNVPVGVQDLNALADWVKQEKIDLTVVGPEEPLSRGIVNIFQERGLRIFGPVKEAARLEWSKSFSKDVMLKAGVKTSPGGVFDNFEEAKAFVLQASRDIVVKADGLAAGKGVVVPNSKEEAIAALEEFMVRGKHGDAGKKVLLEERLSGPEASIIAIVDGETVLPLALSQDYKRLNDNGYGPNTGGMGSISPTSDLSPAEQDRSVETIFLPVIKELKKRGIDYRGFLYAGVMVDPERGVNVIEFNCRLGDPETQVLMMRLKSDLVDVLDAATSGRLATIKLDWDERPATCIVMASKGYPEKVDDGKEIAGLFSEEESLVVFHAGTKAKDEKIVSAGGRILGVTALGTTAEEARVRAYDGVRRITFEGMHFRTDIGKISR
jgi:phosphoribosylamine--glycine ligase